LNIFRHGNVLPAHLETARVKRNSQKSAIADICQVSCGNILGEGAALKQKMPLPRVKPLRHNVRIILVSSALDRKEECFASGQESRPAMRCFSLCAINVGNQNRRSASGRNPFQAGSIHIGINDRVIGSPRCP